MLGNRETAHISKCASEMFYNAKHELIIENFEVKVQASEESGACAFLLQKKYEKREN